MAMIPGMSPSQIFVQEDQTQFILTVHEQWHKVSPEGAPRLLDLRLRRGEIRKPQTEQSSILVSSQGLLPIRNRSTDESSWHREMK